MNRRNFLTSAVAATVAPMLPAPLLALAPIAPSVEAVQRPIPVFMTIQTTYVEHPCGPNLTALIPYTEELKLRDGMGLSPEGKVRKFQPGDEPLGWLIRIRKHTIDGSIIQDIGISRRDTVPPNHLEPIKLFV